MSGLTMLDRFDDCQERLARAEAFCHNEVLDRPYVKISFSKRPLLRACGCPPFPLATKFCRYSA